MVRHRAHTRDRVIVLVSPIDSLLNHSGLNKMDPERAAQAFLPYKPTRKPKPPPKRQSKPQVVEVAPTPEPAPIPEPEVQPDPLLTFLERMKVYGEVTSGAMVAGGDS